VKLGQLEITSVEMKFTRRTAKYTWQGSLSELKINPVVKKIKNYRNIWIQHVRQMDRDRLAHLIMKCQSCGKRSQGRPLERHLNCYWDWNRSRGLKSCRLYDDEDDDDVFHQSDVF
jgi:hypothetical protein